MDKLKKFIKKNKKEIIFYGIIFILVLILCALFPYSHDDWAWGSKIGIERLNTRFYNYNGRWIANLLVLVLTRSYILRVLFVSISLIIIFYLTNVLIESKNKILKYFSLLFFASIPHLILMQSVVWVSGFTNYVFSAVLILIYFLLNKETINLEYKEYKKRYLPLFFVLGLLSTLCVEHVTIYCVLLSLFFLVLIYIKKKKIDLSNLSYFIGSIVGSIIMFSNKAYHSIAVSADEYRNISPITNMIKNFFDTIINQLVINSYVLNIVVSVTLVILLFNTKFVKRILNILKNIVISVLVSFPIYALIIKVINTQILLNYTKYFNGLFVLIYLIAIFISLLMLFKKKKLFKLLFAYFSIAVVCAPLVIVSPIGPRCFYITYVFHILFALLLLEELFNKYKIKNNIYEYVKKILIIISSLFYVIYFIIYALIFRAYIIRYNYLMEHIDDAKILLPKISNTTFVQHPNPEDDKFMERFKLFYNIDEDTIVEFLPYNEWKKVK